jgi:hypothetical protein
MLIKSFTIEYGVKQDNMTVYGEPGYMPKVGIVLDLNIVYDEFPVKRCYRYQRNKTMRLSIFISSTLFCKGRKCLPALFRKPVMYNNDNNVLQGLATKWTSSSSHQI